MMKGGDFDYNGCLSISPKMSEEDRDEFNEKFCSSNTEHPELANKINDLSHDGEKVVDATASGLMSAVFIDGGTTLSIDNGTQYGEVALEYAIKRFFAPRGHTINGSIEVIPECFSDREDFYLLEVCNNECFLKAGRIIYDECGTKMSFFE